MLMLKQILMFKMRSKSNDNWAATGHSTNSIWINFEDKHSDYRRHRIKDQSSMPKTILIM